MAHMLVEANDVCLTYHEPTAETRAIEHLSFQINLGEFALRTVRFPASA